MAFRVTGAIMGLVPLPALAGSGHACFRVCHGIRLARSRPRAKARPSSAVTHDLVMTRHAAVTRTARRPRRADASFDQQTCRLHTAPKNRQTQSYIQITYRLHTDYIQLHKSILHLKKLHTSKLITYTTYNYIHLHTKYIQITNRLNIDYIQYTNYILFTYKLHTDYIHCAYKLQTDYIQIIYHTYFLHTTTQ